MTTQHDINPHNMKTSELRTWAAGKCDQWNWNAGLMDIVEDIKAEEIRSDSREFRVLCEEFNKFFKNPKFTITEAIKEILERDEYR